LGFTLDQVRSSNSVPKMSKNLLLGHYTEEIIMKKKTNDPHVTAWVLSGKMAGSYDSPPDVIAVFDSKPDDDTVEEVISAYSKKQCSGDCDDWESYYDGPNGGEVRLNEVKRFP